MPSDKPLKKAKDGYPAQNWNPDVNDYEESYGSDHAAFVKTTNTTGKPIDPRGPFAKEPFSGSNNITYTFSTTMLGFAISNDGAADLAFKIGTDTFTVKSGEMFSEMFSPFTQVVITTTVPFRAYGLGD